jgi:DEAD/DEAH box helicase domain-containing protein
MKRLFGVEVCSYAPRYISFKNILQDVEEIVEDGAPSGKKDYLVWDPPSVKNMDPGVAKLGQSGSMYEAINLMIFLMMRGVRVILFCKVRTIIQA